MEYVKRESIVIDRKTSLLFINFHVLYILEFKISKTKFPPVCLSVYLDVLSVDTITFR